MNSIATASDAGQGNRPSIVTARRLARNTFASGLASAWSALVTLAMTPFLLHHLGVDSYGLWVLALGLTFSSGFLALADLGLAEASVKFVAEADSTDATDRINEIASTTVLVFSVIGAVLALTVWLLAPVLVSAFDIPTRLTGAARVLFGLMGLEILLELPSAALRSVIEGMQRYGWLRLIDVVSRLVWAVMVVVVVTDGRGVVALGVITLLAAAVRSVASLIVAHRVVPGLLVRPRFVSAATLRQIMSLGGLVSGLRLLTIIYAQMDRIIIATILTVASIASYEVAFRMQSIATLVLVTASSAVVPAAAYNAMRADHHRQRALYLRGTKCAVTLTVPVCIAGLLYAHPLMVGWVGTAFAPDTAAARLFLVFPLVACVNQVGIAMMIGLGRVRRVLLYQAIGVGVNLVLSISLASRLGIKGVVVGTLVGGVVMWVPYLRLLLTTFRVRLAELWVGSIRPAVPAGIVQATLGVVTMSWFDGLHSLAAAVAVSGLSCALFAAVFALTGLDQADRDAIRRPQPA